MGSLTSSYREAEGQAFLRVLYENPDASIAVDTESRGLRYFDRIIGVSIAAVIDDVPYLHYFAVDHDRGVNVSRETLDMLVYVLQMPRKIGFANVQYDVLQLEQLGIDFSAAELYDVQAMAHLIDENEPFQGKSLDTLARFYLHDQGKLEEFGPAELAFFESTGDELHMPGVRKPRLSLKWEKTHGWPNTYPEMIFDYAAVDAATTWRLLDLLIQHPAWLELPEDIWQEKQDLIRVLLAMRRRGVAIDTKLAREYVERGEAEMDRLRGLLGLNPASPKDQYALFIERLGLPIVKKSKTTGRPSFDKTVMARYDELLELQDRPEAKIVKEFRGWQKAVSAAYRPYLDLLDVDGRLRCTYKLHGTTTGRLSASEPNLQQIPKESDKPWNGKVKECFIAEEGYVLLNADFSQLELRLATAYAGEAQLKQVFAEGRDIFTEMSKQLGMVRQDTKTLTYSMQYGAGIKRLMEAFRVTKAEADAIRTNYFNTYPRFKNLADLCASRVERAGKIRIWSGRYRRFKHPSSESYKAMNSLIQGGAADIVERVMIRCFREIDNNDCRMLLQVHDSITFEVKLEEVQYYWSLIQEIMEDVSAAIGNDSLDVKFAVEVGFWSEREEAVYNAWKEAA